MREILFRGRDISGQWHYGVPLMLNENYVCITKLNEHNKTVEYKTLGQYTGLTDKNGNKIFEGDIVKYKNTDGIKVNGVALTIIGKVNYNEKNASFAIDGKDKIGAKHYDYFPIKNIEVIGNIHDNPELLKEAEQE